ncbi:hypothetical protein CVT24_008531, partial [Panaeolus cyanescens]
MDTLLFPEVSRLRSASTSTTDSTATTTPLTSQRPVTLHPPLRTTFLGIPHPRFKDSVSQFLGIRCLKVWVSIVNLGFSWIWRLFNDTDSTSSHDRPICPQPTHPAQTPEELMFGTCPPDLASTHYPLPAHDEFECLNLNITAPKGLNPHARLPVMVWVHGGGHRGSGSEWYYDPGSIVEKSIQSEQPVIWVTINFRIGLLGWATCPSIRDDNKAAGNEGVANFGLHDQRTALEWIHHNIAPFGGDPHNVTLVGAGTGAADIVYHLLSQKNGQAGGASPYCPFTSSNTGHVRCHECDDQSHTISAPNLVGVQEETSSNSSGSSEDLSETFPTPTPYTQPHHHHYPYRLFERAILQSPIFETVLADVNTAGWHLQRVMGALGITGVGGVNSKEGLEKLRAVDVFKIVNVGNLAANGRNASMASTASAAMSMRVVDDGDWFREGWQGFFKKDGGWNGKDGPAVARHGHRHGPCSSKSNSRSRSKVGYENAYRSGGRSKSRDGRNTSKTRNAGRSTSRNPRSKSRTGREGAPRAHPLPFNLSRDCEEPNKENVAGLYPGALGLQCASCGLECEACAKSAMLDRSTPAYPHPPEVSSTGHLPTPDYTYSPLNNVLGTANLNTSDSSVSSASTDSSAEPLHAPSQLSSIHKVHVHPVCSHSPFVYSPGYRHRNNVCTYPHARPHSHTKRIKTPFAMLQPIIIGDSPADALLWAHPMSYWTATGVVRRLKAICASAGGTSSYAHSSSASSTTHTTANGGASSYHASSSASYSSYGGGTSSLGLSTNLLRAYELSSYVEDDEVGERVGEIVQDTRIGWGVELVDRGVRRERGGDDIGSSYGANKRGGSEMGSVWRYVFDQEGFGIGGPEQSDCKGRNSSRAPGDGLRGTPHYAADLVYLFDHTPVVPPCTPSVDEDAEMDEVESNLLAPGSLTPMQMQSSKARTKSQTQTRTVGMLSPASFAEGGWAETFDVDSDSEDGIHPLVNHEPLGQVAPRPAGGDCEEDPAHFASIVDLSQLSSKLVSHAESDCSADYSSSATSSSSCGAVTNNFNSTGTSTTTPPSFMPNAWLETPITPYTYSRVSCTLLEKWLRFGYGIAPWNDTKVFVFGPEGEVGERSREIFEARRKVKVWEDVLGPLGWATVLKVG